MSNTRFLFRLKSRRIGTLIAATAVSLFSVLSAGAQSPMPVLTYHNDNNRTGAYTGETLLTPANVVPGSFGKLWTLKVTGRIYTQPLYVPNVLFKGVPQNMVFVTTQMNNVYAYNADGNLLFWSVNLGNPVPSSAYNTPGAVYQDIYPDIGILSTPVIDQTANTLFVIANTFDGTNYHFFLHALNLSTGADQIPPVEITGSVPGTGPGSSSGVQSFNAFNQLQRPALLLSNGILYISFGGRLENPLTHGWMFAYSESTLQQIAEFCTTPNGASGLGSFWGSGQGPAADSNGNVYGATGNGAYSCIAGGSDYAMSVLKMQLNGNTLAPAAFFTPWNVQQQNLLDDDIGVCGPLLIPGTSLLVQGGKAGHFYLIDTTAMGGYNKKNDSNIVQDFLATANKIHGSPIYWSSTNGAYVYVWSQNDYLKQFQFIDGMFNTTPVSESSMEVPVSTPGGALSISSNGTDPTTGIVWTLSSYTQSGYDSLIIGELRAFNASDLTHELWDSEIDPTRDKLGFYAKFVPPMIANGKVYAASDSGSVSVYGILGTQPHKN